MEVGRPHFLFNSEPSLSLSTGKIRSFSHKKLAGSADDECSSGRRFITTTPLAAMTVKIIMKTRTPTVLLNKSTIGTRDGCTTSVDLRFRFISMFSRDGRSCPVELARNQHPLS